MSARYAYFFRKARYLRNNIDKEEVDVGPTEISKNWPELPAEFQSDLDAVVNWGDGHAYFFRKARYLRYDIDKEEVDVAPTEISKNWPELPAEFQSDLDAVVNWGDGHAYFFRKARYLRYDIASEAVDVGPTAISENWHELPAEFQSDIGAVLNWGPNLTLHWEKLPAARRQVEVIERLVDVYGYPVNGAAGLVGNLVKESAVVPTCVQGSQPATPLRAPDFHGAIVDFSTEEVMNRDQAAQAGPKLPGVGLAQWSETPRRSGLFQHQFRGSALGHRVLFNMDAQIDYLVHELREVKGFGVVQSVVSNPGVSANDACDEVVYDFEGPEALFQAGKKLPRSDPQVQAVFAARRTSTQAALSAYRSVHP